MSLVVANSAFQQVTYVFGLMIFAAHPAAAQDATHVRAVSPVVGPLIARGIEHSATLRGLVAAIDASDSDVYVEEGSCSPSVRTCLAAVTATESARFIWVKDGPGTSCGMRSKSSNSQLSGSDGGRE